MALREFVDAAGVTWQVWHVVPTSRTVAPVLSNDRRKHAESEFPEERRRRGFALTPGMERGWLCFESTAEKRRLAPVPGDWAGCDEERLGRYLASASPVSRRIVDSARTGRLEGPTHASP